MPSQLNPKQAAAAVGQVLTIAAFVFPLVSYFWGNPLADPIGAIGLAAISGGVWWVYRDLPQLRHPTRNPAIALLASCFGIGVLALLFVGKVME